MGTELDAFPFPQQELRGNRTALEMISSWLDTDDHLAYASDHHHHHDQFQYRYHDQHNQNNHGQPLFHYLDSSPSDQFDLGPLSLLPATTSTTTLDSLFPHNIYSAEPPPLHSSTHHHQTPPQDECDTYLVDGLFTPCESQGSEIGTDDHDQFYEKLMPLQDVNTPEQMSLDETNYDKNKNNASAEDNEEDDEMDEDDRPSCRPSGAHCKNLVSERNRRKRLSRQLLALRALVPNITKMDKRSVLVDALNYLKSIHEETARLQKEVKQQHQKQPRLINDIKESCQDNLAGTLRVRRTVAPPPSAPKSKPQITEIDTEKIEDRRFVVKIACKGSGGVGGDVLRVIESMGWEITNATVLQISSQEILATIFIKVRKPGKMTEEKLKDCITSMALRSGLTLQNP
ncbi:hypothetical protein Scep_007325 [Stephania cephalantha]|uniref:BHLH domain-containing protein n=1 Tax=Stephania cephalantha TaxID=152367 RepID=A0AAP0PKZ7_9MAGN